MKQKTNYCIRIAYDGSHFLGWAKQQHLRTVEGEINKLLQAIFHVPIKINGVSRTDTGVHAVDQVFTFILPFYLAPNNLLKILQQHFIHDILIKNVSVVSLNYDVRKFVQKKEYRYYINNKTHDPFKVNYQLQFNGKIAIKKIKQALKLFVGTHYFYNFSGLGKNDQKHPYRTVDQIKVFWNNQQIVISFKARGFLRYQIRYMIAAALDCAQNKITLAEISSYLNEQTRKKYPYPKAAAQGLYLFRVLLKADDQVI